MRRMSFWTAPVSVTVHRHSAVALTDAEADRILRDMEKDEPPPA